MSQMLQMFSCCFNDLQLLPAIPCDIDATRKRLRDGAENIRARVTGQGHAPPSHLNGTFEFNADEVKDDAAAPRPLARPAVA